MLDYSIFFCIFVCNIWFSSHLFCCVSAYCISSVRTWYPHWYTLIIKQTESLRWKHVYQEIHFCQIAGVEMSSCIIRYVWLVCALRTSEFIAYVLSGDLPLLTYPIRWIANSKNKLLISWSLHCPEGSLCVSTFHILTSIYCVGLYLLEHIVMLVYLKLTVKTYCDSMCCSFNMDGQTVKKTENYSKHMLNK